MIPRSFIRITGPPGSGKTTLIERVLDSNRSLLIACARFYSGQSAEFAEIRKEDPHLDRFKAGGAFEQSVFHYSLSDPVGMTEAFWESDLMMDISDGFLLEEPGPLDLGWNYSVFVVQPLRANEDILAKKRAESHAGRSRDVAELIEQLDGKDAWEMLNRLTVEQASSSVHAILSGNVIDLRDPYRDLVRSNTIVINVHGASQRQRAEATAERITGHIDQGRIQLAYNVSRPGGRKFTVLIADLADRKDEGSRWITGRIRRAIREGIGRG